LCDLWLVQRLDQLLDFFGTHRRAMVPINRVMQSSSFLNSDFIARDPWVIAGCLATGVVMLVRSRDWGRAGSEGGETNQGLTNWLSSFAPDWTDAGLCEEKQDRGENGAEQGR
jgi:hypothetical protein